MSVNYMGLINGNIGPIDLCGLIQRHYGGSHFSVHLTGTDGFYQITFDENYKGPADTPPWDRKVKTRRMSMWIDGQCACDYADVTTAPMTMIDLGHNGDCKEIIDPLVRLLGGYVKDEVVADEWVRLV